MSITLRIERLVLDGISLPGGDGPLLRAAVEAELTRLLTNGGRLGNAMQSGGAWYSLDTTGTQCTSDGGAAQLGKQIAGAVYGGICK